MVLALCILGVAAATLLLIALVDRPKQRLSHPLAMPVPPAQIQQETAATTLDPYVMR